MIIVNVKENESIEKALKRFKKKFDKTGAVRELRARQHFVKPSVKRRDQVIKAAYKQRMQTEAANSLVAIFSRYIPKTHLPKAGVLF